MTDDRGSTDWLDDRLADAFRARADAHSTPGDLSAATIDRVRATSRGTTPRRRVAYLGGLVAAAVVVAIAIAALMRPSTDRTGDDTTHVFGLQGLTVSQAIEVRDAGVDDRELAVAGFLAGPALLSCPFDPAPPNPTNLGCPEFTTWLMEAPESLVTRSENSVTGRGPAGPALHPSFAEVDQPPGRPLPEQGGSVPTAVVLIGHFDDRRSRLCPEEAVAACADTFIVDRVDSVEGSALARSVRLDLVPLDGGPPREAVWAGDDVVDRLRAVAPNLETLSVVGISANRVGELEPALATGALGIIDRPIAWLVTGLDAGAAAGPPVRRTFLLVDATAEAYESAPWDVSNVGFVPFTLVGTPLASDEPSPTSSPSPSSADFPTQVLGLGVASVGKALELHPQFDDAELAISGWYVSPDPAASCPGLRDQIRPVKPPCNEGRAWLLEKPEQLWSDARKSGIDRQPSGPYLNPIIPSDIAFDVPNLWTAESPDLLPVVVVGHFADPRVADTYNGNTYFVVDQLVWAAGEDMPNRAVRLVSDTVESEADVMARIDRVLEPTHTSWISLVRGSDLAVLDEGAALSAPELTDAATVWIVRRLVMAESDGARRLVMETAFTPDRSTRVWSRRGCCSLDLATTIDIRLPHADGGGGLVEVADRTRTVVSARLVAASSYSGWRPVGPKEGWYIEVAAGDSPQELAIRWTADRCETTWRLTVETGPWLDISRPFFEGCDVRTGAQRAIVVTFDHPINIDDVRANDNLSGG